jgi:hypothetical protein
MQSAENKQFFPKILVLLEGFVFDIYRFFKMLFDISDKFWAHLVDL